jgi:5-methylcytosine-specific restriction endonuclease McrA
MKNPPKKLSVNQAAYQWYLRSAAWRDRRTAAFRRANGNCEKCGEAATEVHHTNYLNLFAELPSDLVALCRKCHAEVHHMQYANDNQLRFLFDEDDDDDEVA